MKKSIVSGKLNHKSQQSGAAGNLPLWRKPKAVLCGAGFRGSRAQAYSPRDLFKLSLAVNVDSHLECRDFAVQTSCGSELLGKALLSDPRVGKEHPDHG